MANLILIRGLPGSGKSTKASLFGAAKHLETDMFFIGKDGEYRFDPNRLPEAHRWCQEKTKHALSNGSDVVVTNTFTTKWELDLYFDIARDVGAIVHVMVSENWHAGENSHGVPDEALESMKNRFEYKL